MSLEPVSQDHSNSTPSLDPSHEQSQDPEHSQEHDHDVEEREAETETQKEIEKQSPISHTELSSEHMSNREEHSGESNNNSIDLSETKTQKENKIEDISSSPSTSSLDTTNSLLSMPSTDLFSSSPSTSSASLSGPFPKFGHSLELEASGEDTEEERDSNYGIMKSPKLIVGVNPQKHIQSHTWSHFEATYNDSSLDVDPCLDLLRFPPSSVAIYTKPREWRTDGPCVPKELLTDKSLPAFIKDCIEVFTQDWTVISLSHDDEEMFLESNSAPSSSSCSDSQLATTRANPFKKKDNKSRIGSTGGSDVLVSYPSGPLPVNVSLPLSLPLPLPAPLSLPRNKGVPPPPPPPPPPRPSRQSSSNLVALGMASKSLVIEPTPTVIDPALLLPPESTTLVTERHDLFQSTYDMDKRKEVEIVSPFPKNIGTQIILQCKELRLGDFEPFFCSLALYDVVKKTKLSESFYFELNSPSLVAELELFEPKMNIDRYTQSRTAMLTLPASTKGIYLILRVNKLLRPDNEKHMNLYLKNKTMKPKDLEKLKKETKELTGVLQPFVWSYVSLSDIKDEMTAGIVGGEIIADDFRFLTKGGTFTDESICDLLANEKELKKTKGNVTGLFIIDISKKQKGLRINNSYNPIKPFPSAKDQAEWGVIKELQPFTSRNRPKLSYCNNLYVYPETCNFKINNVTVMIDVSLKPYPSLNSPPCVALYGTYPGPRFVTNATTAVILKDRKPLFTDEIKILLPGKLTPQHHLFFTFYSVSVLVDSKKKDKNSHLTPVGYAFLPLYKDGRFISDDRYTLYPVTELPANYLNEVPNENKKNPFVFRTRALTIYPQDKHLVTFSETIQHVPEWDFLMATRSFYTALKQIDKAAIVEHFIVILNELFMALCTRVMQAAREAFLGIIFVLNTVSKAVDEKSTHHSLLYSYVKYVFKPVKDVKEGRQVHNEIVKHWLYYLDKPNFEHFSFNWFLLDIITKSMTFSLFADGKKPDESKRSEWFSQEYMKDLQLLAKALFAHIDKDKIKSLDPFNSFNIFLKDLFYLMDRGFVFKLIHTIFTALSDNNNDQMFASTIKFKILEKLVQFEHYVQLNLPVEVHITSIANLRGDFRKRHYPASLLIDEIELSLSNSSQKSASRSQTVGLLKSVLKKHESDTKNDQKKRERITAIYLPFIICVIENDKVIKTAESDWLLCFFFILKNCSRRLLCEWWRQEPQQRQKVFIGILAHCLKTFENDPLLREICCVILEIMIDFIKEEIEELQQPGNIVTPALFSLIQQLLQLQNEQVLSLVYSPFLRFVVELFSRTLFVLPDTSPCEAIDVEILRHCNDPNPDLRNMASSMFFLMLLKNIKEAGNIHRMLVQSTVAISRLVGEHKLKEYSLLTISLESIKNYAKQTVGEGHSVLIDDLIHQLFALLRYNSQISQNLFDPAVVADIYHKISLSYFNSPNLRVTWLTSLCGIHVSNKCFEEASLCKVNIAVLVIEYLERNKIDLPITKAAFNCVSPAVMLEPGLPEDLDESIFKESNSIWKYDGLVQLIIEAVNLMVQATMYEMALELFSILILLFKFKRNYTQLSHYLDGFKETTQILINSNKKGRLFPKFYRVGFYGAMLKDLDMDGKEFIYKREPRVNLSVFQQQLKDGYSQKVGAENVVIMPNAEMDLSQLEPGKLYIQIASVRQLTSMSDSSFEQYFNANEFIFESAHTEGKGPQQSETSRQQKKKTIFRSELSFPYFKTRLLIISKNEVILTPIENAIELLEERMMKIRQVLDCSEPRVNVLQQLLQGSIVPMVNEGPLKICEIFLTNQSSYPEEHIATLKAVLQKFSTTCAFALSLNRSLITTEYMEFHNMLLARYKDLKQKIIEYTE